MNKNLYRATLKNAYVTFVSHYNKVLDVQSFEENEGKMLRETRITCAPLCMKEGSLCYAMHWMKWKMNTGPLKDFYDNEDKKRKRKARLEHHRKVTSDEITPTKKR